MKKALPTIGILTLTALAGVLWYLQSEKDETKTVSVVNNAKDTVAQEAQKEVRNEKTSEVLTEKDGNDVIDTSDWKEYCNEEYGFCVKYPKNWRVKKYKTFSPGFAPGPIGCDKTPQNCRFEGLLFLDPDKSSGNDMKTFNVQLVDLEDLGKDYKPNNDLEVYNIWMTGLINGCLMKKIIKKDDEKVFILFTFYDGMENDNSRSDNAKFNEKMKQKCEKGDFAKLLNLATSTFRIMKR